MKKITSLLLAIVLVSVAKSQSLELTFGSAFNDTIYSVSLVNDIDFEIIGVKNITEVAKNVKVERFQNTLTSGQENWFCWDNCYSPAGNMSATALTLNAGATSYAFTLHGNANGNPGVSTTMYRLFDVANTSDKIERKFVFKFGQAVGIADEINPAAVLSAPYPNPATQSAEVRFQFPRLVKDAALVIYDLQGKQVAHSTISASQGLVMIDTKGFTNGMYQIVLQGEGAILAQKKLIVAQ